MLLLRATLRASGPIHRVAGAALGRRVAAAALGYRTVAAALALAALAACGTPDARRDAAAEDVPEAERFGGTVVIGTTADVQSVGSLTSSDANSTSIQQDILFMTLVRYNEDLRAVPYLAAGWDSVRVAPDTLEVTFRLRSDVRWHDGVPTTAEDVRFTYEAATDPATAYPNRASLDLWDPAIEVVDSFTVRLRVRPHADFLAIWYELAIMPAHILGDVPRNELARHPFTHTDPVGNGPFRFVSHTPNQEWVFEANPDFPEELGGRPYLDRLVYRVIPEQTTLLTELLTGGVDVYLAPNPAQAEQIAAAPDVELLSSPYRAYTYIGWNTQNPLFDEAATRRALSLAINRQALVDALLYGHGDVGISTSTPAHWAYPVQEALRQPYDPEGARRLLAEAGWQDRDQDGVLEDEDGRPFRFELVTNQGNDLRRDAAEVVQAQLRTLGIVAEVRSLEWNTLVGLLDGSLNARGQRERGFEAVLSGWVTGFRKDDAPLFHSRNVNDPYQETSFSNPRVDELIDTLAVTLDRGVAQPLWTEYHRLLLEESPYTVLYYPRRLLGHRNRVRGVRLDVRGDFVSVADWWIAPSVANP